MKKIGIIGIGGGGCKIISKIKNKIQNERFKIETVVIDANAQNIIENCLNKVDKNILIGKKTCDGLGCGGNPLCGAKSFNENKDEILSLIKEYEYVFIVGCVGGGCATGCIDEMRQYLDKNYILVLQTPMVFEGKRRKEQAEKLIEKLKNKNVSLINSQNEVVDKLNNESTTFKKVFIKVDNLVTEKIKNIIDNL